MAAHSIAEAKKRLPELIDRALNGEDVVLTRRGRPVVQLRPIRRPVRPVSAADLDWLKARRVKLRGKKRDAGALVSSMRDEGTR
jgi:prevent-host-death family protein